jgi:hypothetical protein
MGRPEGFVLGESAEDLAWPLLEQLRHRLVVGLLDFSCCCIVADTVRYLIDDRLDGRMIRFGL